MDLDHIDKLLDKKTFGMETQKPAATEIIERIQRKVK